MKAKGTYMCMDAFIIYMFVPSFLQLFMHSEMYVKIRII
jgi:hypothetical protein